MNVGIFFDARRDQGGLYQYALTLVHALYTYEKRNRYTFFHATMEPLPLCLNDSRWIMVKMPRSELSIMRTWEVAFMAIARWLGTVPLSKLPVSSPIRDAKIDVMLYVKPSIRSFLWAFPSILPVHDLAHLLHPEFPEVSAYGELARRQYLYSNAISHANAILAPSSQGRKQIIEAFRAEPKHVYVLPYLAPTYLSQQPADTDLERVRQRYKLPSKFLFYPAAFWKHKNHARLIRALALVRRKHDLKLPLLLAGRANREYGNLYAITTELGLNDQVNFMGYVPDEDMYPLYMSAFALSMPTFFGPANIPVLEAWALGCPVITSDVDGTGEEVGDAGFLVDPRDEQSIAEAIWRVYSDDVLRRTLIENGKRRVQQWTPCDFAEHLGKILSDCVP